jgi:endonuclease/exonuclease/phosphatase family metal-dependent hydrolase
VRFPLWLSEPRKWIVVHDEPRPVAIGTFETPDGPLVVANTHLSFVPAWRRLQLQRIRRDLAAVPGDLVLMGDLNMTEPSPENLTGFVSLAHHPTFPATAPLRQLDHILVRGRLGAVTASSAVELALSDHRALVVDVAGRG